MDMLNPPKSNKDFRTIEEIKEFSQKHPRKFMSMLKQVEEELELRLEPDEYAKKHPRKYNRLMKKSEKAFNKALENFEKYGTTNKDVIMMQKHPILYEIKKGFYAGKLEKFLKMFQDVQEGKNAFAHGKNIHINLGNSLFYFFGHEKGHVIHKIMPGLGNVLQKLKIMNVKASPYLLPLILGTAILRDKKSEGQSSESAIGKGLDYIKDNCVGLTALTQLPTLAEEGLASKKGLKMIKDYVKPNEYKMLRGAVVKAWLTYFASAAATTAAVAVANCVKNVISGPKENTACTA